MADKLPPKIIIVESEDVVATLIRNTIERYCFDVSRASNLDKAIRLAYVDRPNLAAVGSKLKDATPLEVMEVLRKMNGLQNLPVIFLLDQKESKAAYQNINNLTVVLTKPLQSDQLMLAIKDLFRKSHPVFHDKVINHKSVKMNLANFRVTRGDKQINLGPTEFKILQFLIRSPNVIYTRQQIIDYVWGTEEEIASRTVDVHINRIRSLLRKSKDEPPFIKTVHKKGYCLNLPGEIS